jgi:hypothetical protein
MAWVQVQKAEQASWDDYERVAAAIGATPPDGLVVHAAGEVDGKWQAVSLWESKEAFEAFRNERVIPAVSSALGEDGDATAPPPSEWFEVKHTLGATG